MKFDLTSFAARLCDFIADTVPPTVAGTWREGTHAEAGVEGELRTPAAAGQDFNSLALDLFALQFAHNAAYRPLCAARGATPATVDHWSRIPAVPAAAFKELELTCLAPAQRTAVFHSSGTTGQQPSRHFHSAGSLKLYAASLWRWFDVHVLGGLNHSRWQLLILAPTPVAAPHSSLVCMFEMVRQRSGAGDETFVGSVEEEGAWTVDFARAEATLHRSVDSARPLVLLGTAFNFVHLLDALAAKGLRFQLPPGSRVMETGGYKGRSRELSKPGLHELIQERLGVPHSHMICEYGMCELSSQAYDGVAGFESLNPQSPNRIFHFPPWCQALILSPETGQEVNEGETGLLRLFDLANVFSVMAVQTEDLAFRRGDGFELVGRAVAAEPRGCSLMPAVSEITYTADRNS